MKTIAQTIKNRYFSNNVFVEVAESGYSFQSVLMSDWRVIQFKDNSRLLVYPQIYDKFIVKMNKIKDIESKKAAAADTKESRIAFIIRCYTIFGSEISAKADRCVIEECIIRYKDRDQFEEAVLKALGLLD